MFDVRAVTLITVAFCFVSRPSRVTLRTLLQNCLREFTARSLLTELIKTLGRAA